MGNVNFLWFSSPCALEPQHVQTPEQLLSFNKLMFSQTTFNKRPEHPRWTRTRTRLTSPVTMYFPSGENANVVIAFLKQRKKKSLIVIGSQIGHVINPGNMAPFHDSSFTWNC